MIIHTKGLVLSQFKYGDNGLIVKIYTEAQGIKSFMVDKGKARKGKIPKSAIYQPLYLLELVTFWQEKFTFGRINESQVLKPFHAIQMNAHKRALSMFLLEVLLKCLKEEEENVPLFAFLNESFSWLNSAEDGNFEVFHLSFLLELSVFLGFGVSEEAVLLEQSGVVEELSSESSQYLSHLLNSRYDSVKPMPRSVRPVLLSLLLNFYAQNIPDFGQIKSLTVLREVFL